MLPFCQHRDLHHQRDRVLEQRDSPRSEESQGVSARPGSLEGRIPGHPCGPENNGPCQSEIGKLR